MDIPVLSAAMSQSSVMQQANISLAKLAMNTNEQTSQNMTDMIEKAASPNLGNHIDTRV